MSNLDLSATDASTVRIATQQLNNAAVKNLANATPVTIVPAPSAGFRIKLLGGTFYTSFAAGAYTGVDTTFASLQLETAGGSWLMSPILNDSGSSQTDATTFFGATARTYDLIIPSMFPNGTGGWMVYTVTTATTNVDADLVRLAMDNSAVAALGGGNAANTLTVRVYYVIEATA